MGDSTTETKDAAPVDANPDLVNLVVRTVKTQKNATVSKGASIKELREKAAQLFELASPTLAVLIFGGKILKDEDNLSTHSIQDGQTVHLVIRHAPPEQYSNSSSTTTPKTTKATTNSSSQDNNANENDRSSLNNNPLGSMADLQSRMQQMMISNPEAMQRMLNPMVQRMTDNPEFMRSMFGNMSQLFESNPELNQLLTNPEALRESLSMVSSPAALQEFMRNYDRALNNMESTPGGYNVLRRMYTELQEPLIDAMQEQMSANRFSSTTGGNADNESDANLTQQTGQQRTENRDPLPNPWAASSDTNTRQQNNSFGELGSRFLNINDPNVRSMVDATMQALASNPELLSQVGSMFGSAPNAALNAEGNNQGGGNGGISGRNQPTAINELQPEELPQDELNTFISNPEAIQALMQIQQGYNTIRRIAPNLSQYINAGMNILQNGSNPLGALSAFGTGQQTQNTNISGNVGNQTGGNIPAPQVADANLPPPEERYSNQLQRLSEMGFTDRELNLRVLISTFGDINQAISRILESGHSI